MLLILLIFIIQYVSGNTDLLTNETLQEIQELNELKYYHESNVYGDEADFTFIIYNTTYAIYVLRIDSYYFSITFIDDEPKEHRMVTVDLPNNQTEYHGRLIMENLEEHGNYFICVFFYKNNGTELIGSSRFCHVVSVSNTCKFEKPSTTFSNRLGFLLLGFVGILLIIIVVVSYIRDYIYRPRTIEDLLKTLPQHHADNLESLAPNADTRRKRSTQPALKNRLREDSVLTVEANPNTDNEYYNYHAYDNASLDTLTE